MKSSKFIFYLLALLVLILVVWIGKESFTQPGLEQFEGKYKPLSSYRNENNTGPVVRIITVKALDSNTDWMRSFGDFQPHTKYGRTMVFFFSKEIDQEINLSPTEPYFTSGLKPYVLATYEKGPMGDVKFIEGYPK
ncbi:hypothetical protein FHS59_000243 [Algoriphagus iocasae]|uniref:Uncharacterized protein n=1 Tax=Algoriphagus iocasae TaxID=1836499 RepID=A0A841MPS3_9BACT|nr:hypothetical protein [Algoriphagus iocasae]MBB6324628.1 hypothetical protein [Algoriphagus iocasae]